MNKETNSPSGSKKNDQDEDVSGRFTIEQIDLTNTEEDLEEVKERVVSDTLSKSKLNWSNILNKSSPRKVQNPFYLIDLCSDSEGSNTSNVQDRPPNNSPECISPEVLDLADEDSQDCLSVNLSNQAQDDLEDHAQHNLLNEEQNEFVNDVLHNLSNQRQDEGEAMSYNLANQTGPDLQDTSSYNIPDVVQNTAPTHPSSNSQDQATTNEKSIEEIEETKDGEFPDFHPMLYDADTWLDKFEDYMNQCGTSNRAMKIVGKYLKKYATEFYEKEYREFHSWQRFRMKLTRHSRNYKIMKMREILSFECSMDEDLEEYKKKKFESIKFAFPKLTDDAINRMVSCSIKFSRNSSTPLSVITPKDSGLLEKTKMIVPTEKDPNPSTSADKSNEPSTSSKLDYSVSSDKSHSEPLPNGEVSAKMSDDENETQNSDLKNHKNNDSAYSENYIQNEENDRSIDSNDWQLRRIDINSPNDSTHSNSKNSNEKKNKIEYNGLEIQRKLNAQSNHLTRIQAHHSYNNTLRERRHDLLTKYGLTNGPTEARKQTFNQQFGGSKQLIWDSSALQLSLDRCGERLKHLELIRSIREAHAKSKMLPDLTNNLPVRSGDSLHKWIQSNYPRKLNSNSLIKPNHSLNRMQNRVSASKLTKSGNHLLNQLKKLNDCFKKDIDSNSSKRIKEIKPENSVMKYEFKKCTKISKLPNNPATSNRTPLQVARDMLDEINEFCNQLQAETENYYKGYREPNKQLQLQLPSRESRINAYNEAKKKRYYHQKKIVNLWFYENYELTLNDTDMVSRPDIVNALSGYLNCPDLAIVAYLVDKQIGEAFGDIDFKMKIVNGKLVKYFLCLKKKKKD